ncbi:Integral membrane protein [Alloactinosynnema sp. L-07]|uniref:EamA family transporter n=1 Tax=Alloactinosynnema sp. L-07 TaxID=1653480 RepID=UPI00065EF1AD|nr:DMT family transporter [Alloactinosynnema sp. L-07]CRK55903.1 Integral membrane protein [Alloactinosynnema sp. L-07]
MVVAHVERAGRSPLTWIASAVAGTPRLVGSIPPTAQVLLGIVSVQVGAAFAKQLFSVAGSSGVVTLRLVFAAAVLLLIWRPSWPAKRDLPVILSYGVVLATMNVLFYLSLERIPLGIAVTVEFLGPLAVALLGSRRILDVLWALLAAGGVVLLAQSTVGADTVGLLFALGAGVCWAAYILLSAALGSRSSDGSGLALAMACAGLVAAPFGIADAGSALLSPTVLVVGLGVALMSSVIPYSLELEALRKIPPRVFGVLMSMEPAVAAVAGLLVLSEALTPLQWVAICCVVAASAGATRTARPDV